MKVFYIEKGAIKTALNKLKNTNFSKVSKTAAKKIAKTTKLMTQTNVVFATSV